MENGKPMSTEMIRSYLQSTSSRDFIRSDDGGARNSSDDCPLTSGASCTCNLRINGLRLDVLEVSISPARVLPGQLTARG